MNTIDEKLNYIIENGTGEKRIKSITSQKAGGINTYKLNMLTKNAIAFCNIHSGGEGQTMTISSEQSQVYQISEIQVGAINKIYNIEGNINDELTIASSCSTASTVTFIWYE